MTKNFHPTSSRPSGRSLKTSGISKTTPNPIQK
jgi:hypothetical protein